MRALPPPLFASAARDLSVPHAWLQMGWRSWNAFGNRITQDMMLAAADAIVAKNRTVAGHPSPVSLCDLGYCSVGVDVRRKFSQRRRWWGGRALPAR